MTDTILVAETVVEEPDFLGVGIKVSTFAELLGAKYVVYSQTETWFGFDTNIAFSSQKVYLEGKVEGLEQTVRIELSDVDVARAAGKLFHELAVKIAEVGKTLIKAETFKAVGRAMGDSYRD